MWPSIVRHGLDRRPFLRWFAVSLGIGAGTAGCRQRSNQSAVTINESVLTTDYIWIVVTVWLSNQTEADATRTLHTEIETPDNTYRRKRSISLGPRQRTSTEFRVRIGQKLTSIDDDSLDHETWVTEPETD